MKLLKSLAAGLVVTLLLAGGAAQAATDLNEVGALLVYPVVIGVNGQETFMTITNAGPVAVAAHVSFINGDPSGGEYCYECDFTIPLTANDTETLVLTNNVTGTGISIESEDGTVSFSCDQPFGFVVVALEDGFGNTISENYLLGEEVVVDYVNGYAWSVPAIPFQGIINDGDRDYNFDDLEYAAMPRIVAADFIAPDLPSVAAPVTADLALFTLGFARQFPPFVDCSITGYDAAENPFSDSIQFGCWTIVGLYDISSEFAYPNLGQLPGQSDTHGYVVLDCFNFDMLANGGVHGAILQTAVKDSVIRRNDPVAPVLSGSSAWARLLYQSVTVGGPMTLSLESTGSIIP